MPDNIPGGLNFSLLEKMPLTVAISEKIIGAIQKAISCTNPRCMSATSTR